ncbi:hypothetical protein [Streptomyces yaizuensis]|uniref:Peptidase inhibitor family I36 protein n=1 Tax=Streptomyces yaizuensis TaxID=2989713 RepID=A0ABQ5PAL1_9ACTN|nr:hypothetical protein [Streptomyces sp. YSPA8]GLF99587.1 peptidase inhibitor family I36 protein [Streptomyces sp. YSPA8]
MRRIVAVLATATALALCTALPATAADTPRTSGTGEQCVADVATKKVTCFDTFREAAKAGSEGAVTTADNPAELKAAMGAMAREDWGNGRTWLGTASWDAGHGGDSLYFWGDRTCLTGNGEDYAWDLGGSRWNDQISSLTPSSGCWITLYQHSQWGGSMSDPFKSPAADLGWWNDRTSTISFG